jgi:hypothetical protein
MRTRRHWHCNGSARRRVGLPYRREAGCNQAYRVVPGERDSGRKIIAPAAFSCCKGHKSPLYHVHQQRGSAPPKGNKQMTTKALEKKIAAARNAVRAETFGTDAWEAAMATVRALVNELNAATDFGTYTSIDGDIFAPRGR